MSGINPNYKGCVFCGQSECDCPYPNAGREAPDMDDYNESPELAKQRVAIVKRVMKLPYIKATRDTERGEERFVCRDDVIKAIHDWAVVSI